MITYLHTENLVVLCWHLHVYYRQHTEHESLPPPPPPQKKKKKKKKYVLDLLILNQPSVHSEHSESFCPDPKEQRRCHLSALLLCKIPNTDFHQVVHPLIT